MICLAGSACPGQSKWLLFGLFAHTVGNEKYVNVQMTGGDSVEQIVDAERERERLLLRSGVDRIVRFRVRETYDRARFIRKLLEAGVPLRKP